MVTGTSSLKSKVNVNARSTTKLNYTARFNHKGLFKVDGKAAKTGQKQGLRSSLDLLLVKNLSHIMNYNFLKIRPLHP